MTRKRTPHQCHQDTRPIIAWKNAGQLGQDHVLKVAADSVIIWVLTPIVRRTPIGPISEGAATAKFVMTQYGVIRIESIWCKF